MHILLTPFGSAGDVLPLIFLGKELRKRGHEVTLMTASLFADPAKKSSLPFIPIGSDATFEKWVRDPRIWRPLVGTRLVFEFALKSADAYFTSIETLCAGGQRPDLILSPMTAVGSRMARERFGIPLLTVHLQPAAVLSGYAPPVVIPGLHWMHRLLPPSWLSWLIHHAPNPLDWLVHRSLSELCARHRVTPPKSFLHQWWDSPDGTLLLFPDWFAAPQLDWPQPHLQWDFPLEDLSNPTAPAPDLSTPLTTFLDQCAANRPIVFTAGSANVQACDFFLTAKAAIENSSLSAVFVTRELDQIPASLPPQIHAVTYTPFSPLLRRAAAFVHHGGIGTLSQGFAAAVPQLIMPMAHDQPDNAARLKQSGAGDFIHPRNFTAERLRKMLLHLTGSPDVSQACKRIQQQHFSQNAAQRQHSINNLIDWITARPEASVLRKVTN